jgi:hypothetical protein
MFSLCSFSRALPWMGRYLLGIVTEPVEQESCSPDTLLPAPSHTRGGVQGRGRSAELAQAGGPGRRGGSGARPLTFCGPARLGAG